MLFSPAMSTQTPSRRELFRLAGLAAAAPLLTVSTADAAGVVADIAPARKPTPLKVGIASYSLRKFPLDRVIQACKDMNIRYLNLKDFHLARTDPPETTRALRKKMMNTSCSRSSVAESKPRLARSTVRTNGE